MINSKLQKLQPRREAAVMENMINLREGTSLLGQMGVCAQRISGITQSLNFGRILRPIPRISMWFLANVCTTKKTANILNLGVPRISGKN